MESSAGRKESEVSRLSESLHDPFNQALGLARSDASAKSLTAAGTKTAEAPEDKDKAGWRILLVSFTANNEQFQEEWNDWTD
ncbi:MAG TPA: hypothetical protein VIH89_02475 [Candidatus Sulfotelmatobacter sp.]